MPKLQRGHELVKFTDGQYGVRKKCTFNNEYEYLDIKRDGELFWWSQEYCHRFGRGTYERVAMKYGQLLDVGQVVEDHSPAPPPKKKSGFLMRILKAIVS